MRLHRAHAKPSPDTFRMPPVAALLDHWLSRAAVIVDPFARNSRRGTHRNDLNPATMAESHLEAVEFLDGLDVEADAVLFDPPYSPRQIAEVYSQIGRAPTKHDTQNMRLYREVRLRAARLLKPHGLAITCGWNTVGFGREFVIEEILLVCHGGAHNDTIVTVQRKVQAHLNFGGIHAA